MSGNCLPIKPYEYVVAQLRLTPNISYHDLLIELNEGQVYNTTEHYSPTNADNFAAAIRWVKKYRNMKELKEALKNVM